MDYIQTFNCQSMCQITMPGAFRTSFTSCVPTARLLERLNYPGEGIIKVTNDESSTTRICSGLLCFAFESVHGLFCGIIILLWVIMEPSLEHRQMAENFWWRRCGRGLLKLKGGRPLSHCGGQGSLAVTVVSGGVTRAWDACVDCHSSPISLRSLRS